MVPFMSVRCWGLKSISPPEDEDNHGTLTKKNTKSSTSRHFVP